MKTGLIRCVTLTTLFFLLIAGVFAAAPDTTYISPNNDGVQDELTVPFSISEKRYIKEWSFIVTDEAGRIVRTIVNKDIRPEKMTAGSFLKALITPKQGVAVPATVIWNGILDSGETASDGVYYYYFTAADDNSNTSKSKSYMVVVDNTPPEITLVQPRESDKFFGEGNKAVFNIAQSGSVEDRWTGAITDSGGRTVRTFEWAGAPQNASWDGRNDQSIPVADGVYSYHIKSTDRAGNVSSPASITNIIYSAERPATNIAINGSRYFSPNGDGAQDTVTFDVTIPAPQSGNLLTRWQVTIVDASGALRRTYGGQSNPDRTIVFDGKDASGAVLSEGQYQAVVTAQYLNGFETTPIRSPVFILDVTQPSITLRAESSVFSPDGDGNLDTIGISQTTSRETDWKGEILDKDNRVIKTYSFGSQASNFTWNGQGDSGNLCEDGFYTYRLSATDLAGNKAEAVTSAFELNTGTTEVILTVRPDAFSPNGDGVQDAVTFTPVLKTRSPVVSYVLSIKDAGGQTIRTITARSALPATLSWNGQTDGGTRASDGFYTAQLDTVSQNGSESSTTTQSFELDTVPPSVSLSAPYLIFSPDGDGQKDMLPFTVTTSTENRWTGTITGATGDARGRTVRTFVWENTAAESFAWDGTDEAGNTVPDGTYRFALTSTDAAGNSGAAEIASITSDARPTRAWVTLDAEAFSPNGDGLADAQKFNFMVSPTDGIETWRYTVTAENGQTVREWKGGEGTDAPSIPAQIPWDGKNNEGGITEGTLKGVLNITYAKGNIVRTETSPFILSVTPPRLGVQTSPQYFSPDNDGNDDDLLINLRAEDRVPLTSWSFVVRDPNNGREFWKTEGKSAITERIVWDGRGNNGELVQSAMDYPYTFSASDSLGMSSTVSGIIPVDVLVIRVGDVLKMQVPAIIFRSNNADFAGKDVDPQRGLERNVIDNNIRVLKRIAEILNKFKDYQVRIEGHANSETGTEAEETSTANGNIPLVPLSLARAETVKKLLTEYGVDSRRLSTIGMGGRQPVVPLSDRENWWKNRRVEFILVK
jgi:flagellar hook assembly protein FlgD